MTPEGTMRKIFFGLTFGPLPFALSFFGALLLVLCYSASAQQQTKIPRIAWLTGGNIPPDRKEAFRLGLRELGYIEGEKHND
jgi:hypothetical protein